LSAGHFYLLERTSSGGNGVASKIGFGKEAI
jgi:hypothetical protein